MQRYNIEVNQKILAKEGILKGLQDKAKQYKQNKTIENNERKVYQQVAGECTRTNYWMQNKQPDFGIKYGNRKNITKSTNG